MLLAEKHIDPAWNLRFLERIEALGASLPPPENRLALLDGALAGVFRCDTAYDGGAAEATLTADDKAAINALY